MTDAPDAHPPLWIEWFANDKRDWERPHILNIRNEGSMRITHASACAMAPVLGVPIIERTTTAVASRCAEVWLASVGMDVMPFTKIDGVEVEAVTVSRRMVKFWNGSQVALAVPYDREVIATLHPEGRFRW